MAAPWGAAVAPAAGPYTPAAVASAAGPYTPAAVAAPVGRSGARRGGRFAVFVCAGAVVTGISPFLTWFAQSYLMVGPSANLVEFCHAEMASGIFVAVMVGFYALVVALCVIPISGLRARVSGTLTLTLAVLMSIGAGIGVDVLYHQAMQPPQVGAYVALSGLVVAVVASTGLVVSGFREASS